MVSVLTVRYADDSFDYHEVIESIILVASKSAFFPKKTFANINCNRDILSSFYFTLLLPEIDKVK